MKKKYEPAKLEIIELSKQDIMLVSGDDPNPGGGGAFDDGWTD